MTSWLLVGAGGFLGAALRYGAHLGLRALGVARPEGLATLGVNLLGCLAGGALLAGAAARPEALRLFLVVGLLGGFTTFSAFGVQGFALLQSGAYLRFLGHALAHVGLGLLAVVLGYGLVGGGRTG